MHSRNARCESAEPDHGRCPRQGHATGDVFVAGQIHRGVPAPVRRVFGTAASGRCILDGWQAVGEIDASSRRGVAEAPRNVAGQSWTGERRLRCSAVPEFAAAGSKPCGWRDPGGFGTGFRGAGAASRPVCGPTARESRKGRQRLIAPMPSGTAGSDVQRQLRVHTSLQMPSTTALKLPKVRDRVVLKGLRGIRI